ncbi:hypothetical protein DID75_02075 [Candidatus Marinamargulisbacteria bacterium SCGC AG-410-N11]|nr:hypothetical protein DID75_02075 [Candidatus Marinamargulisbacteria bacterium SCGC AG-410-N11]
MQHSHKRLSLVATDIIIFRKNYGLLNQSRFKALINKNTKTAINCFISWNQCFHNDSLKIAIEQMLTLLITHFLSINQFKKCIRFEESLMFDASPKFHPKLTILALESNAIDVSKYFFNKIIIDKYKINPLKKIISWYSQHKKLAPLQLFLESEFGGYVVNSPIDKKTKQMLTKQLKKVILDNITPISSQKLLLSIATFIQNKKTKEQIITHIKTNTIKRKSLPKKNQNRQHKRCAIS